MKLLHAVLTPTTKVVRGVHKKHTISDSQKSFTLPVQQAIDIDDILLKKREDYIKTKTTLQPLLVIVGNEFDYKNFYVFLDDSKFLFDSYLEALQFCFKLMYVLNLKYPIECISVWTFIQKFLFEISDECINPVVDTFIRDLNI